MRKQAVAVVMVLAIFLLWAAASLGAQKDKLPRVPGATLLMEYLPDSLMVTTGNTTATLDGGAHWSVSPSMSADGRIIASARAIPPQPGRPRLVVGTYSMADKRWVDYQDLAVFGGTVAISPDGSKVACVTSRVAGSVTRVRILDLGTGVITEAPESVDDVRRLTYERSLSWSPDGRRIVLERDFLDTKTGVHSYAIYILNVETLAITKLTDGISPSWSPSGDWIMFFTASPRRFETIKEGLQMKDIDSLAMIRPDRADYRTVMTRRSLVSWSKPVWSPDSKMVLLNQTLNRGFDPVDIYLLDVANGKLTKKFGNTRPVFAWVAAR